MLQDNLDFYEDFMDKNNDDDYRKYKSRKYRRKVEDYMEQKELRKYLMSHYDYELDD